MTNIKLLPTSFLRIHWAVILVRKGPKLLRKKAEAVHFLLFCFHFLFEVQLSSAIVTSHLWWAEEHAQNIDKLPLGNFFFSFAKCLMIVFISALVARRATSKHSACTKRQKKKRKTIVIHEKTKKHYRASPKTVQISCELSDGRRVHIQYEAVCHRRRDSILVSRSRILCVPTLSHDITGRSKPGKTIDIYIHLYIYIHRVKQLKKLIYVSMVRHQALGRIGICTN